MAAGRRAWQRRGMRTTSSPHTLRRLAAGAAGAAALAAAGGAATTTAAPTGHAAAAHKVHLKAASGRAPKFDKHTLHVQHGKVTLVMKNPGGSDLPHGIAVEGHGIDKDGRTVSPGGTSRVTVKLEKGRYEFYCPVRGHEAAGMKGTLVVK